MAFPVLFLNSNGHTIIDGLRLLTRFYYKNHMKKIQMVDLFGQYEHIQEEVDKAVIDVIRSSAFIKGPDVKKFEEFKGNVLLLSRSSIGHKYLASLTSPGFVGLFLFKTVKLQLSWSFVLSCLKFFIIFGFRFVKTNCNAIPLS